MDKEYGQSFDVHSNDEAMKRCLYGIFVELWSTIKTRELIRQVIFFECNGFHVGNVVSGTQVSLLEVPGHRPSSLQMTSK